MLGIRGQHWQMAAGVYQNSPLMDEGDDDEEETSSLDPEFSEEKAAAEVIHHVPEAMSVSYRFRSHFMLLWGGVFGIMGFLIAFIIGIMNYNYSETNWRGVPYPSGHGYWPATVSEMVYAWNSPQGRIFFGFCLISAFLIFQSWYPFELRNVFTGPETMGCCGHTVMYWTTFRQLVPVVGLLTLICVSTVPSEVARPTDVFAISVHLIGAAMMFVGYILAELKLLQMFCFKGRVQMKYLDLEPEERKQRAVLMIITLVAYLVFCVIQVIMVVAKDDSQICCHDVFPSAFQNMSQMAANSQGSRGGIQVENTASGVILILKISSFMSEVIAGLSLIGSHIVIWYWCEERHVSYGKYQLLMVYDEEAQKEMPLVPPGARDLDIPSSHLRT